MTHNAKRKAMRSDEASHRTHRVHRTCVRYDVGKIIAGHLIDQRIVSEIVPAINGDLGCQHRSVWNGITVVLHSSHRIYSFGTLTVTDGFWPLFVQNYAEVLSA